MFKRFISIVLAVLFSWTMAAGVNAATKKHTNAVKAKVAIAQTIKVCSKEEAKKVKAPNKARVVTCKKKTAHVPSKQKRPPAAKTAKSKLAEVKKKPIQKTEVAIAPKVVVPDPVQVKCLAKLGLGEAGAEPPLAQKAVLYVAKHYSVKVTFRSVCKETRDKTRYSYLLFPKNLKTIARTVSANGDDWAGVKTRATEVLSNYPEPPLPVLEHATTYLVVEESTKKSKNWIMENTYPIGFCGVTKDFKIGKHVFRTERKYAWEKLGIVCPLGKPYALANLIAQKTFKKLASNSKVVRK